MVQDSPHLVTLTDDVRVAAWIEEDTAPRMRVGDPLCRIAERGTARLREAMN